MQEEFDTAQICINGHAINERAATKLDRNQKFCDKCGAETIMACPHCQAAIRGHHYIHGIVSFSPYTVPPFCCNCGKPFPWTEARLVAAREMIEEIEKLDGNEKIILSKSLDDLIRETPSTPTAIVRFKRLALKAGSVAADGLRSILVDVLSEAVRKQIWPN